MKYLQKTHIMYKKDSSSTNIGHLYSQSMNYCIKDTVQKHWAAQIQ